MPVRIIFRGLILYDLVETGPDQQTLVAELINKRDIVGRPKQLINPKPNDHSAPHGPHEHSHTGRIQVATGDRENGDVLNPVDLLQDENLTINVIGGADRPSIRTEERFYRHVPRLSDVMANASIPAVTEAAQATLRPNDDLVRTTVRVDRGLLRVRSIVTWDHGAFPLSGRPDERGGQPASHVGLKFVGSNWQGHMASEFIVDIDAVEVEVKSDKPNGFKNHSKATGRVNHRVPYNTVEILITNYEVQEHTAVPWGLDFQWLFERVGYPAADLAGADFDAFESLGRTFDRDVYDNDTKLLLEQQPGGTPGRLTRGRPFPYIVVPEGLERLTPLNDKSVAPQPLTSTDEEDRPICIGGFK